MSEDTQLCTAQHHSTVNKSKHRGKGQAEGVLVALPLRPLVCQYSIGLGTRFDS